MDVECDSLVSVTPEAPNFQVGMIAGVDGVADRRWWLRRAAVTKHALVPGIAGQPIGFPTRAGCTFSGGADRRAINPFARLCTHDTMMSRVAAIGKPLAIAALFRSQ